MLKEKQLPPHSIINTPLWQKGIWKTQIHLDNSKETLFSGNLRNLKGNKALNFLYVLNQKLEFISHYVSVDDFNVQTTKFVVQSVTKIVSENI